MNFFRKMEPSFNRNEIEADKRVKEIESYLKKYFQTYDVRNRRATKFAVGFWDNLEFLTPDLKDLLEQKLKGKALVDLGAGENPKNIPHNLNLSLNKYTAVDLVPPAPDMQDPNDVTKKVISQIQAMKNKGIEASFVESDILRFVMSLPDKSSNFTLSGIDLTVIKEDKYWDYLCEEIYRATEDNGIIIDADFALGGSISEHLDKTKFKTLYKKWNTEIFEKI